MNNNDYPKLILEHKVTKEKFHVIRKDFREGVHMYYLKSLSNKSQNRLISIEASIKFYYTIGEYE